MIQPSEPSGTCLSLLDLFANGLLFLGLLIGVAVLACATAIVVLLMFFTSGE